MKNNRKKISVKYAKIKLEQWESKSYFLIEDEGGEKILVCPRKKRNGGPSMSKYLTKEEFYKYARVTREEFQEYARVTREELLEHRKQTKKDFDDYKRETKKDFDEFKHFMMDFVKRQDKNWENQFKFNKYIANKLDRVITLNNLKH